MEPPPRYVCPIGQDLMRNPVMCPDGHNFDRPNIEAWLNKEKHCPLDRKSLAKNQLYPNRALKKEIEEWEKKEKDGQNNNNVPQRAATVPSVDLAATVPAGPPRSQSMSGVGFAQQSHSHQQNYNASAPPMPPSLERDMGAPWQGAHQPQPPYPQQQQPPPQGQYGSYYQNQNPGQYPPPQGQYNQNQMNNYPPPGQPWQNQYPPQYNQGNQPPYQHQQGYQNQNYQHQHQPPHHQPYQQPPPPNYNPNFNQPPPQYGPPAAGAWQSAGGNQYTPPQAWQQPPQQPHYQQQYNQGPPVVPVPQSNVQHEDQPWRRYGMKQEEYDNIVAVFCMVDEDDSGQLDRDEVRRLCEMLQYPSDRASVDRMFQIVDRDRSGSIDLNEFVAYMIDHRPRPEDEFGMTRVAYQQLQLQFHEFDTNRDGSLNQAELQRLCKHMGYPSTPEVIKRMFAAIDTDRSGSLSFREFLLWMKDNQPRQLAQTMRK